MTSAVRPPRPMVLAAVVVFLLALGLVVMTIGRPSSAAPSTSGSTSSAAPAETSADVGFARDMSIHHQQAVEMSVRPSGRSTGQPSERPPCARTVQPTTYRLSVFLPVHVPPAGQ